MKIFDTHAHYNDQKYDIDREHLFKKMKKAGVDRVTCISASLNDAISERALVIKYNSENKDDVYPKFYYTVGDHPDEIIKEAPDSEEGIKYLSSLERMCYEDFDTDLKNIAAVAVGEIGLDYYGENKNEKTHKHQADWFIAELNLARKLKLPLVIHSREACKDTYDIIRNYARDMKGVIHCFGYEKEIAYDYINMGYFIGVGGVVTFKNARKLKETVEAIPLESIVVETDCPYLSPTPHRGERNESTYIRYVIEEIANIKNVSPDVVSEITYDNALKLYNLH